MMMAAMMQESKSKSQDRVNNSFCHGCDHSMLLKTKKKNKSALRQDIQQSVDEKENESIHSNQKATNDFGKEIRNYMS